MGMALSGELSCPCDRSCFYYYYCVVVILLLGSNSSSCSSNIVITVFYPVRSIVTSSNVLGVVEL